MNILVTNDDGIYAKGLLAAVKELQNVGQVTVIAPDRDQSGAGTSVSLRLPVRYREIKPLIPSVSSYLLEGTPGDCVIIALRMILKGEVDLVVSGINEGSNLGNDIFISGTVGAALQGYAYGIPSIAVSVAALGDIHYEVAARVVKLLADAFKQKKLPSKMLMNVNAPNLPLEKIEGLEITSLGDRSYVDRIDQGHDGKREYYWIVRGIPEWSVVPGTDVWALEQNKISVTPFLGDTKLIDNGLVQSLRTELFHK